MFLEPCNLAETFVLPLYFDCPFLGSQAMYQPIVNIFPRRGVAFLVALRSLLPLHVLNLNIGCQDFIVKSLSKTLAKDVT
jgi:hypothetical protein